MHHSWFAYVECARSPTDCLAYCVYTQRCRTEGGLCGRASHRIHRTAVQLLWSHTHNHTAPLFTHTQPYSSSDHTHTHSYTTAKHQSRGQQHVSARIQPVPGHRPWNRPRNIQNRHGHHCKHGDKCSARTIDTERYVQRGGGPDGGHAAEARGRGASGLLQPIYKRRFG